MTSTQEDRIYFLEDDANIYEKYQERLPEVLSAVVAIMQYPRFEKRYTIQFIGDDRSIVE